MRADPFGFMPNSAYKAELNNGNRLKNDRVCVLRFQTTMHVDDWKYTGPCALNFVLCW
jgi:hypothetical protein